MNKKEKEHQHKPVLLPINSSKMKEKIRFCHDQVYFSHFSILYTTNIDRKNDIQNFRLLLIIIFISYYLIIYNHIMQFKK